MSEQAKMSFLEKLDYLMKRDGLIRQDVSNGTGIPRSTIDNWFSRKEQNPKREQLVALSKFFNVSLHYLCVDECVSTYPSQTNPFANVLRDGETLAFHFEGKELKVSDMTEEEIEEIIKFIQFVHERKKKYI